ncbi:MAG TPA: hypothetical protein VEP90_02570 [Methylomirabilota bacterium]|nr:hypothetical protein [Methylomirabilota bacterium]
MTGIDAQQSLQHELDTLISGSTDVSNQQVKMLLVETILKYLQGEVMLNFVLTTGAAIHRKYGTHLTLDLIEATTTLTGLAEHIDTTKPRSFVEHQKIEDQLATILAKLS